jgi:hypothetical protein
MHEDNSLPSPEPTEDRPLADHESAAVTGGTSDGGWIREIAFAMGQAMNNYANKMERGSGALGHEPIHAS